MKYGYFDDQNREYVITRPDTPMPWANYLGSPEYGALISGNAGGYSFAKSGANGRILRYIFNQFDQPGRYLYLRDNATGDYWSASWQPVGKPLAAYRSECRHGMGYTVISADYSGIHSQATYYVPDGKTFEVWSLTVRNDRDTACGLTVTGFAEFTNVGFYENDQINLQYSQFITRTQFHGNRLIQQIHGNLDAQQEEVDEKKVTERFFCMTGSPVASYCGDKKAFLGSYRQYGNPIGVESSNLGNVLSYNENVCGALSTVLTLAPGESQTIAILLGEHDNKEAEEIANAYADPAACCQRDIAALKALWNERVSTLQIKTPSPEFDTMLNTWNAYNCFMTFIWSRAASFTYCGLRNGYGYRDTVQDIQGVIHLQPEMAADKLRFMLSAQVDNGGGLPLVKFTHNAGHEDTPDDASYVKETGHPAYRADDALWLFPTVYKYVAETGNLDFLREVIPFANRDEGTVYEHLKRALNFSRERLGPHGMPAGLYADWNDCLRLGANGESTFVALQFYYAYTILKRFAQALNDGDYLTWLTAEQEKLSNGKEIHWTINPNQDGVYQQKLDEALMNQGSVSADQKVDLFLVEADYALKYTDADVDVAVPLAELGITDADLSAQFQYTKDVVTDVNGQLRGTSWQATPGLFAYRRSIAKDVFGTDDPVEVQAQLSDWSKFEESARKLQEKGYFAYSSVADTYRVFNNNVSGPWVQGTKVIVDPNTMAWVEQSKTYTDEKLNHNVGGQWTDEWNADQAANSKVFGFFYSTWGINFTLVGNAGEAGFGDWAVCPGPQPFFWGGSWLIGARGTDNAEDVKDIMLAMTANPEILVTITKETQDFTNNEAAMNELASDPSFGSAFLGGQNHVALFAAVAPTIDMSNISAYDQGCGECFQNAFGDYFHGQVDFETAKKNFEIKIMERYPELTEVVWP